MTDKKDVFDVWENKPGEPDLFDLLGTEGTKKNQQSIEKKPTNLEVLIATQELTDKAIKAQGLEKEAQRLQAEFESMRAEIMQDGARIQEMAKNYDPSFDAGLYAMLPESLTIRQLQRIAELHKDLKAQGYNIRLLRYSHESENNWIAWKPSILRGNVSIEIITRIIETDEYHRTSLDVSGTATESTGLNLLSIELEGITFDEIDRAMLTEDPQLITLTSNTQDCRQKTSLRHAGIKLIVPTPALNLPAHIVFMMIENNIAQVEAQVISAMTDPLKHMKA